MNRLRVTFSTRFLMAVIIVVSVPLAGIAYLRQQRINTHLIAQELEAVGQSRCTVFEKPFKVMGLSFPGFQYVGEISTGGSQINDDLLLRCPLLEEDYAIGVIDLSDSKVTDRCLQKFSGMKRLRKLFLNNTRVGGAGLKHLSDCSGLTCLSLSGCEIDDQCIEDLSRIPNLVSLNLSGTRITGNFLGRLSSLVRLEHLHLGNTKVTSECLNQLRKIPSLEVVYAKNTLVDSQLPAAETLPFLLVLDEP